MNDEMIYQIRMLGTVFFTIIFFVIIYLIIRAIWRAIKRFTFEIIDHANGTSSGANPRAKKKDYTAEARRACEAVTPKKDKNSTPPWEE